MNTDLLRLGYTNKWKEFEVLKDEELRQQVLELKKGEDTNTEHYRYKTLCSWMDTEQPPTEVGGFI